VETCAANALAVTPPNGTAQAQCDDGFGLPDSQKSATGAPVYNTATPPQVVYVACNPSVTDTRYTVNGGAVITLPTVDASASASVSPYEQASASVSYTVNAYPVTVIPSGAILGGTGNWNILVGQNCIPYLSIPGLPSAITVGWPTWTVSGDTFTSFDIGSGQNTGQAIPFPNPNANISVNPPPENPTFFWKDSNISGNPETISGWANLYTDAAGGLSPNPNVSPSAEIGTVSASAQVQVWEPEEYTTPPSSTPGTPAANPVLGTPGLVPTSAGSGTIESGTNGANGFSFAASVVTPSLFTAGGNSPGYWAWLQLVQVNEMQGSNGTQMASPVLDSSFPYATSGSTANGVPAAPYTASPSSAGNPVYNLFTDTPDFPYYGYQTAVVAADAFHLYVMYQPPDSGTGVNWVPLDVYAWAFNCDMTRPNVFSNWTPNPPGSVVYVGGTSNPSYPSWSDKYAP
jgi:hypothetical protein